MTPEAPRSNQELTPSGPPPPSHGSRRKAQQLCAQLSDTRSAPAATLCMQLNPAPVPLFWDKVPSGTGTTRLPVSSLSHTDLIPSCPTMSTAHSRLNCNKTPGHHTKPNKASLVPQAAPRARCSLLTPPQGNASSGKGLMEDQEAATSCCRKRPWLPSPPASCSNHLFCFYFQKRWGSALRRSQPPSQPPHCQARRQISAKR